MKKVKLSKYAELEGGGSVRTLWRRIKKGELEVERSNTGRVFVNLENKSNKEDYTVVYTRVSSSENKGNLESQVKRVTDFCIANGWIVKEIVKEVGSGLNDERKKLLKILTNPKVTRLVIEHKDRLTRFGFNYLKNLWNGEIVVINEVTEDEQDLMQDFVSLVTSFCARLYGKRRTKRNTEKLIKELNKD